MVEWFLEDPSGVEYAIEPDDWTLDRYYDEGQIKASTASLNIARRIPARRQQWIRMVDDGKTQFLGYVSRKPSISGISKKSIQALGVEALLMNCPLPPISLPYDTYSMQDIFSDTTWPGFIYGANSYIPPGWLEDTLPAETTDDWIAHGPCVVEDATNGIVKLANCGSRTRLSTTQIYVGSIAYTEQADYATAIATDRSTFRDADDLWIHFYYDSALEMGYKFLPLYCLNAFDTRCRMGTVDNDVLFTTPIKVGPENMAGQMLVDIATVHDLNVRPRYSGKICYIDALEDFEDDGLFEIHEDQCSDIDFGEPEYSAYSAFTGLGACPRLFQQQQSIVSVRPGGAFIRSQAELPEAYYDAGGNLCLLTTAQWSATQPKHVVRATTDRHNFIPLGSNVALYATGETTETYQLRALKRSSKASSVLELGARSLDLLDAREALDAAENAYAVDILPEIFAIATMAGTITVGATNKACVAYVSNEFTLPAWDDVSAYNPRCLADIEISATNTGLIRPYTSTAQFRVAVNTGTTFAAAKRVQEASSQHYIVSKDSITGLDITRKVTWGTGNYLQLYVALLGALPSASDNTDFTVSLDIYVVGRRGMT